MARSFPQVKFGTHLKYVSLCDFCSEDPQTTGIAPDVCFVVEVRVGDISQWQTS